MLLEISQEEIDRVVVNVLKQQYIDLFEDINSESFTEMHEADQRFMLSSVEAIEGVLRYFMVPSEAEIFINMVTGI